MATLAHTRFSFIEYAFYLFISISIITRTILLIQSLDMIDFTMNQITTIYTVGLFYDILSFSYLVIPFVLYLAFLPQRMFVHKANKYINYIFSFIIIFALVLYSFAEWFFWDEFSVRFNFIAVDYLVYTTEVIGNIRESYPMGLLLSIIFFISSVIFYFMYHYKLIDKILKDKTPLKIRTKTALGYILAPILAFLLIDQSYTNISKNQYNNELAKSGLYSLFSAFRNNTLDYKTFYISEDEKKVFNNLKSVINTDNATFRNSFEDDIYRTINAQGKEKKHNVMLIVVESLSGKYIKALGGDKNLTPNLDALTSQSLFFTNFYATGTRTVRGMESITLSIPPTAGRSIVKRQDNHNMFSSGFIFKDKGYDTKFIYGGHGYFDNMNDYFSNNGFDVVDRTDFSEEEDTFHTVWGVCDEDLFDKTLKEADQSYKEKKPFMHFVMTTSNHRPYDYPDGKIDMPSHISGRDGAVKYTDYAIGDFLKKAKTKPWFKDTIFVVVADHCASSAGKMELPLNNYHIPMFVYAPDILKPKVIDKVSSQIDIMPTLFSMLNWSYTSKFYGKDILSPDFEPRALVGTYQKLGLYKNNHLSILSAGKKVKSYEVITQDIFSSTYKDVHLDEKTKDELISYYQGASTANSEKLDRFE